MSEDKELEENVPHEEAVEEQPTNAAEEATSSTVVDGVVTDNPDYQEPAPAPAVAAAVPFAMTRPFSDILTDFFDRYARRKVKFVPRIVDKFAGHEETVLLHLCKKYKVNPSTIEGVSLPDIDYKALAQQARERRAAAHTTLVANSAAEGAAQVAETVKKKKSPLLLIIILVVILGGGGAAGWFFKDQLAGMFGGGDATTEEAAAAEEAEAATPTPTPEPEPEPEPEAAPMDAVADSAEADSAATDGAGMTEGDAAEGGEGAAVE